MDESLTKELFKKLEDALAEWTAQGGDAYQGLANQTSKVKEAVETLAAGLARPRDEAQELAQRMRTDLKALQKTLAAQSGSSRDADLRIAQLEQTLAKRQDAITEGQQQIARLEQALAERSEAGQAAQQRVGKLERDLAKAQEAVTKGNQRIRELEPREHGLQGQVDNLGAQLTQANADKQTLNLDLETSMADLSKLREEKEALGEVEKKAEEFRKLLEAERRRAEDLGQKLHEEKTKKTKSALAQQLAEALREGEAAQEEISALRAELEKLGSARTDTDVPDKGTPKVPISEIKLPKRRDKKKRDFGEILVDAGVITQKQLSSALEEQRKSPQRHVGAILTEKGLVTEEVVGQAQAHECGVPFVRLAEETLDPEAAKLLSARLAKLHTCMPIRIEGDRFVLAMANPLDLVAIEDIERTTNLTVTPVVAAASEITGALEESYGAKKK